jgi:phosphinothricin acetyltransferase
MTLYFPAIAACRAETPDLPCRRQPAGGNVVETSGSLSGSDDACGARPMVFQPVNIRLANEADLPAINAIYNHYVPISTTTYDLKPMTMAQRRKWFKGREGIHPVTVALPAEETDQPGDATEKSIVGWGALNTWRAKPGYRLTVENSVYVHPDHQRSGVGSAILLDQIERARQLGVHVIVAGIDAEQEASLALHYKHGFREVARFPQVGYKFDRWLDAVFMQLTLQ